MNSALGDVLVTLGAAEIASMSEYVAEKSVKAISCLLPGKQRQWFREQWVDDVKERADRGRRVTLFIFVMATLFSTVAVWTGFIVDQRDKLVKLLGNVTIVVLVVSPIAAIVIWVPDLALSFAPVAVLVVIVITESPSRNQRRKTEVKKVTVTWKLNPKPDPNWVQFFDGQPGLRTDPQGYVPALGPALRDGVLRWTIPESACEEAGDEVKKRVERANHAYLAYLSQQEELKSKDGRRDRAG